MQEEQIKVLEALEDIDQKIETHERDQKLYPAQINRLERTLKEETTKEEEQLAVIAEVEAPKKELEVEVAADREHVTTMSQRLNEMKTNDAYTAALQEIANFRKTIEQKENQILEILGQVEEANKTLTARQKVIADQREALDAKQKEAEEKLAVIEKELSVLRKERKNHLSQLDPNIARKYQFIRSRLHGSAVARVENGACQACHMNVPPQLLNQLQRGDQVYTCPSCKRIIVLSTNNNVEKMAVSQ
ncbi:zinc ribbon domain-containing protein [Bdellovibrionota bacterium]